MTATNKSANLKTIADEAAFQLQCCNEFTGWMVTLMRAIQVDHDHEDGRNANRLAEIGLYLADMHKADVESAADKAIAALTELERTA